MNGVNGSATQYLILDNLNLNPTLARCLPPALAFRYHALPVAKDNDHITVAIANPHDQTACEAIASGLGAKPYLVQGDPTAIDRRLVEVWSGLARPSGPCMLVYHQDCPIAADIEAYAQYLNKLLNGQLNYSHLCEHADDGFSALLERAGRGQNLVIFGEPCQSRVKRLLSGPAGGQAADRLPTSTLVARCPRWPLKNILLITRGSETDNAAVDWLIRLAQPSNADITVLVIAPKMSSRPITGEPQGLSDWLGTDTPLGRQLRRITQQLVHWEVKAKLRFRQGSPEQQIQREITAGDYDLVIIAADTPDWWLRRLVGELVGPLLHWLDRPALIAKPTTL